MKVLHIIAFILVIVGGLNWGLVSFGYNVVDMLLGVGSTAGKVVYGLVGLSALYFVFSHKGNCKMCSAGTME